MKVIIALRARLGNLPLTFDAWCDIVRNHADLVRPESKVGKNPLTGSPITMRPTQDVADVVVEGQTIGEVEWSQDGSPEVLVHGELSAIRPFVENLAKLLDAEFEVVWQDMAI